MESLTRTGEGRSRSEEQPCGRLPGPPLDAARVSAAERILFPHGAQIPWRSLLALQADYCAGSYVKDGKLHLTSVGRPLPLIEDVRFLALRDGALPLAIFPHDSHKGALLPFVGALHGEHGDVPDEVLERAGAAWLRGSDGKPIEYPMFAATARSLLLLCDVPLSAFLLDGNPRLALDARSVLRIFDDLGAGWSQQLLAIVEQGLRQRFQEMPHPGAYEDFRAAERERATLYIGVELLRHLCGGGPMAERLKPAPLCCCGIQFKGSGCHCYDGHHVEIDAEQVAQHPNLRLIEAKADGGCFVVDKRFLHAAGILVWLPHQEPAMVPLGAASMTEALAAEREEAIHERGGRLAAVTLGVAKLLDKEQLPELCCAEIGIAVIAVLDDTRRLDVFLDKRVPLEGRRDLYKAFAVERYGPRAAGMEERSFVEAHFAACRDLHLRELFGSLGRTARAVLEAGLTNPRDQNLMGNISVCGGIADTRNLTAMIDPNQAAGLIAPLMARLNDFGEAAGFESGAIFKQPCFRELLQLFLGSSAQPVVDFMEARHFRTGGRFDDGVQLMKLIGLTTDAWVRAAGGAPAGGYHLNDADMVEYLAASPEARRRSGIDDRTLFTFQMHLRDPKRVTINRSDGVVSLEDALEPFRASLEDRPRSAASTYGGEPACPRGPAQRP